MAPIASATTALTPSAVAALMPTPFLITLLPFVTWMAMAVIVTQLCRLF